MYFPTSPKQCFCTTLQTDSKITYTLNSYQACHGVVFQQDSAPAHQALIELNSSSVKHLISFLQSYAPQQSGPEPSWLQAAFVTLYKMQINNVDKLGQQLVDVWSGLQQSVVDAIVSEWRKHMLARVRAEGGQFEHLLYRLFQ